MALTDDVRAAIETKANALKQRIETAKANFANSPVAADLQAIEEGVDQLVADVRTALSDPGSAPQPATEA